MNNVTLLHGDCLDHLRALPANSVDSVVTDPPYELGFMGRAWDASGIAYSVALWREVARVLKPGGHVVAFGGTRTYHRMACAMEDAGLEIRDSLHWIYGSGFPKSKNVGGGIGTALKPAHEPIVLARKPLAGTVAATVAQWGTGGINVDACRVAGTAGDGRWGKGVESPNRGPFSTGTAPLEADSTDPAGRWPPNVLLTHSAACQPVGTRQVRGSSDPDRFKGRKKFNGSKYASDAYSLSMESGTVANYAAPDGTETVPAWECAPDCPVAALDRQSGERPGASSVSNGSTAWFGGKRSETVPSYGDTGGASRFFPVLAWDPATDVPFAYVPKASRRERNAGCAGLPEIVADTHIMNRMRCQTCGGWQATGPQTVTNRPHSTCQCEQPDYVPQPARVQAQQNTHPTVKPVALMRWLVRLVTPPGGTVLDPFLGSGTTGIAALHEGMGFIGMEQDESYLTIAQARIAAVNPLFQEVAS